LVGSGISNRRTVIIKIYLGALLSFAFCQFALAAENDSLPLPINDKIYTFQQIEQQKLDLNGKIVRIKTGSLLGDGTSHFPNGVLCYIAEDTSKGAMPFGQVAFPPEGLRNDALPKLSFSPLFYSN